MSAQVIAELAKFNADMTRHELFLTLESKIKNPAAPRFLPKSETLLSAFVSLSCGRFEQYLQKCFYHAADDIRQRIGNSSDPRIIKVDKFHWQNMSGFLKWASNAKGIEKSDLMIQIQAFSTAISAGTVYPSSFQYTRANPNSDTLVDMFSRFGIDDSLKKISAQYQDSLGRNFSSDLIKTTLNTFVKRRHQAAHHGRISGVTRNDVAEDKVFILALTSAINTVLVNHLSQI